MLSYVTVFTYGNFFKKLYSSGCFRNYKKFREWQRGSEA